MFLLEVFRKSRLRFSCGGHFDVFGKWLDGGMIKNNIFTWGTRTRTHSSSLTSKSRDFGLFLRNLLQGKINSLRLRFFFVGGKSGCQSPDTVFKFFFLIWVGLYASMPYARISHFAYLIFQTNLGAVQTKGLFWLIWCFRQSCRLCQIPKRKEGRSAKKEKNQAKSSVKTIILQILLQLPNDTHHFFIQNSVMFTDFATAE